MVMWPRLSRLSSASLYLSLPFSPSLLLWAGATGSSTSARAGQRHHPLPGRLGHKAQPALLVDACVGEPGEPPWCLLPALPAGSLSVAHPNEGGPGPREEDGGGELALASGRRGG